MHVRKCSVLVIGAGPAGSAAAYALARGGHDVVLVDQHAFPRDKVCGDALIPDALAALRRLDVLERVLAHAQRAETVRIVAPNGSFVDLQGGTACLPRNVLDTLLLDHARAAGAEFLAPLRLAALHEEGGAVAGADLVHARTQERMRIAAPITLLATGAAAQPLQLAGLCTRKEASGFAVRLYVHGPQFVDRLRGLWLSFDREVRPGYGWIFGGPDGVFNVGAGVFRAGRKEEDGANVRALFTRFVQSFAPAAALLASGEVRGPLKGAPLRTALQGAHFGRAGVLAIGEAAATTYSFSGEGIGKAIESALLAAELCGLHLRGELDAALLPARYATELRARYGPRFAAYEKAERWLARPVFCNFLAARARASDLVRARLEGMLTETIDPDAIFSASGVLAALLPSFGRR
ncbi:MAG TPA: geranylgeranyl reductase family protein [Burkholderiaceae bacterium]|nr:geranylgeranyl reductase family protein [Burkholderiaceae bacterium]